MNPKISIAVDAKNKAVATITGMATVGAKIDVELRGMPTPIPDWTSSASYSGPSIRFRVVDPRGRDVVRFPLETKSSTVITGGDVWTTATESGSTVYKTNNGNDATPVVTFNTQELRDLFKGVAFDDYIELGLILDSIVDSAEYAVGKIKVRQWVEAQTDDPDSLPDWNDCAKKPTVLALDTDSSLDDVISRFNTLVTELKA